MASAGHGGSLPPNFFLTPQQQNLLFAALNSNKGSTGQSLPASNGPKLSLLPNAYTSPVMNKVDAGSGIQESPFLDNYDYDFADSGFDFSYAGNDTSILGGDAGEGSKLDSSDNEADNDTAEKRSHPDDDDDELSPGPDNKRRESSDKAPKKPGRKPLTSEPSSKRKAQNRAAQRAFRERKEQHLKDLETKVEELQKASEDANNENSLLRAQVDRMTNELRQYKQKLSLMANTKTQQDKSTAVKPALNNVNDVNFHFEFPRFGALPAIPSGKAQRSPSNTLSPSQPARTYPSPTSRASPGSVSSNFRKSSREMQFKEDLDKFNNMTTSLFNGSRNSLDSGVSAAGAMSSPSASSMSNIGGPNSSCGTSPEPLTQSPLTFKPLENLGTIGEEHSTNTPSESNYSQFNNNIGVTSSNFDWLSQQNGGQFDPQLFGDYREPQENILANPSFDDFFNDAWDNDFFTPYNIDPTMQQVSKKPGNLIDQIDAQKEPPESFVSAPRKEHMNCNQIWDKLQSCPKAQTGEFDLDGLCSELTKKAKCSGSGPVVQERDFNTILRKYMGKDPEASACVADSLGIELTKGDSHGLKM